MIETWVDGHCSTLSGAWPGDSSIESITLTLSEVAPFSGLEDRLLRRVARCARVVVDLRDLLEAGEAVRLEVVEAGSRTVAGIRVVAVGVKIRTAGRVDR